MQLWGFILTKKNLKIVRIFSRLNIGGPSFHVVNLADRMQDYNFETTLVVGKTEPWEGHLESYAQSKNVTPIFLNSFSAKISPVNDFVTFFKILFLLIQIKPDIVHTHTFKSGLLGRVAAFLARVPVRVHTYHGHLINNYWSGWKLWILKSIEKSLALITDMCLGVSPQVGTDLIAAGVISPDKMKTVSLGFDFSYLNKEMASSATIRKTLNIPHEDFVFGTACRFVPIKNIGLLIKSSVELLKNMSQAHLVLVGEGPEKESLIQLADQLTGNQPDIRRRIHFLNWIVPFQRELKDFNYYVCCSKNEGTSVSVIEALISKVPVVSTAVGGMPDLLKNGEYGELVKPDSIDELSQCLIRQAQRHFKLQSQENQLQLNRISEEVSSIYNEQTLAQNMYEIYKDILMSKGYELK